MIDLLYPPVTPEATEERRRRWQVSLIGQHPGHEFRKGAAGDRKATVPNRKNDARRVPRVRFKLMCFRKPPDSHRDSPGAPSTQATAYWHD